MEAALGDMKAMEVLQIRRGLLFFLLATAGRSQVNPGTGTLSFYDSVPQNTAIRYYIANIFIVIDHPQGLKGLGWLRGSYIGICEALCDIACKKG